MAKKRRKHEEEEEEFHLPEFDEEKFLRKEVTGTKVMLVVVLLALVAAAVSFFLTLAGVVVVAFFAGLSLIFLIRYLLPIVQIDTSGFEKKDWLGQATTYFFTWLSIWILMMNVPFADVTQPSLTLYVNGHLATPGVDEYLKNQDWAMITVRAADSGGIMEVRISIDSSEVQVQSDGSVWWYNITGIAINDTREVIVTVTDASGNPPMSVRVVIARQS